MFLIYCPQLMNLNSVLSQCYDHLGFDTAFWKVFMFISCLHIQVSTLKMQTVGSYSTTKQYGITYQKTMSIASCHEKLKPHIFVKNYLHTNMAVMSGVEY
jgi:hypothetical protein